MRTLLLFLLLIAGATVAPVAHAVTTCAVTAADASLPFGTIVSAGAGATGTLNVTVTCTTTAVSVGGSAGVRVCVGLGTGTGGSTTQPLRTLTNSTLDPMSFQIYNQANFTQVTGLTPGGSPAPQQLTMAYTAPVLVGTGTASTQLYAQVPASQILASGNYSSTFSGANVVITWGANEQLIGSVAPPATCTSGNAGSSSTSGAFSFIATASVAPQCGSYLATNMDFGTVTGNIGSNIDQTATLTLNCLKRTAYQIGLNNGTNAPAEGTARRMRTTAVNNSSQYLTYELYRDPARTQRWGSTLAVDTVSGTGTGSAQQLTIYGRVPAVTGQPAAGTYNDLVTVTITY
ncbi:spore coat U domain-containing protein [Stenotrophomonas sp. RAC2]|uniref:Csu type fimbrial protein n=1 Tax=Stenotrophomonas sp. RAC2 TaxID=3064902 RepID=UPI0027163DD2|nr:spore coat U domain-containing protein [Stenotrophomonas sp. RAC2]MDV9041609.1 spore coat U domain-containing protein [Stenotrophomonas sp. RAC2]